MGHVGSGPAFQSHTLATGTNVPAAASSVLELEDVTTVDISAIDVYNGCARPVNVYLGADAALKLLMTVGIGVYPRAGCQIPKGSRISIRAQEGAALATGSFVINGWV